MQFCRRYPNHSKGWVLLRATPAILSSGSGLMSRLALSEKGVSTVPER